LQWYNENKELHDYKFNELLSYSALSRQAYHQAIQRRIYQKQKVALMIGLILEVRQIHPGMGLKSIHELAQPQEVGRDAFIKLGGEAGLILAPLRSSPKTTIAHPSANYPNLLQGKQLNDVNQLWTSDITYFSIQGKWYYLTFLMDVYSRRIIGYTAADNLRAINNMKTLNMAIQLRGVNNYEKKLIHHSDRGSQYISDAYTELLQNQGILISMCQNVLENAHIERVHRTIKNQYLKHRPIHNFSQLVKWLDKTVYTYNYERPHSSILKMTPVEFENFVKELPPKHFDRPVFNIFTYQHNNDKSDPNQLTFEF